MRSRASIDYEFNAENFWAQFHVLVEQLPAGTLKNKCQHLAENNSVSLSDSEALELQNFCQSIPGFSDGPEWAKTAVSFD